MRSASSAGVAGARGSQDGYIHTALTGADNDRPVYDYSGAAPAWARRVLLASERKHGKPPAEVKGRPGRPRKDSSD